MIIPTKTATAKLWKIMVIPATIMVTKISLTGIIVTFLKMPQLNVALLQAKTKADIIINTITATAKLRKIMVIPATIIVTKISLTVILVTFLKMPQLNVVIATIIITPTNAAIGIISITGAATKII